MLQGVTASGTTFELREVEAEPPPPGEVQVRIRAAGICGSDLHGYRDAERWAAGEVRGHEIAGEIAALGAGVEGFTVGQRVAVEPLLYCGSCEYCLSGGYDLCPTRLLAGAGPANGAFQQFLTVPPHTLFPFANDLDYAIAALAEPLAVGIHGVRVAQSMVHDAAPGADRVVVLGAGTIGLLAAFYARQAGAAEVAVSARYPQQGEAALRLGATHVFAADDAGGRELAAWSRANPVDLVIESVGGRADTCNQSLALVRPAGRVLILGVFTAPVTINTGPMLVKQPRIVSTLTYSRTGAHADFAIALRLLERHRDVMATLITHRFPLREIADGFAAAVDKSQGAVKVTIEP